MQNLISHGMSGAILSLCVGAPDTVMLQKSKQTTNKHKEIKKQGRSPTSEDILVDI